MGDGVEVDFSDVLKLAADLGEVPKNAGPRINSAVRFTAGLIKDEVRGRLTGEWRGAVGSVDYDVKSDGHSIVSEVGYDKDKPGGALGNLREFGAPNAPSGVLTKHGFVPFAGTHAPRAPHNDLAIALTDNQADFQHGLEKALKDAEREAGL